MIRLPSLFFPKSYDNIDFPTAIEMLEQQKLARITKTALFALATIGLMALCTLAELTVISVLISLPILLITVVAGSLFLRLNLLDQAYLEGLTEEKRPQLIKNSLDSLFNQSTYSNLEKRQTLLQINTLIGYPLFSSTLINQLTMNTEANSKPLELTHDWIDQGRFGLSSSSRNIHVTWSGVQGDPFSVTQSPPEA